MGTISEKLTYLAETKTAIKDAIVAKGVEIANSDSFRSFADKIASIETGGGGGGTAWTGHADADGLRAIGWTDDDIAYYQANGVNWNEEDDQYHLVSDDNKALYGVLTASNISTYKDRIVYLPKIDTSGVTNMYYKFNKCYSLVAIPFIDTSNVTQMTGMFSECVSLVSIPQLDTSSVWDMGNMFNKCYSLTSIPQLNTSEVITMYEMFNYCYSLKTIPLLDSSNVTTMESMFYSCYSLTTIPELGTDKVNTMRNMFAECYSLTTIPLLDVDGVDSVYNMFINNYSLTHLYINNIGKYPLIDIPNSPLITKESLLYIINNATAASDITITLHSYAYTRLAEDADVVAALANHPNISLAG